MIRLKPKKRILLIFFIFLCVVSVLPVRAQNSEFPLIYTEVTDDGGIIRSYPIIDDENILHSFIHLRTDKNKIIHHYVKDNVTLQSTFAINFIEIEFIESFLFNGSLYLFYSEYTISSLKHYKLFRWSYESESTTIISSFDDMELLTIDYTQSFFANGTFHFFNTHRYGFELMHLNVTHYSGLTNFTKEEFFVADPLQREIIDIILDKDDSIWYLYQEWAAPNHFGIFRNLGIGLLQNQSLTFVTNFSFEGIFLQVAKIEAFVENKDIFSVLFFHSNTMFYGTFNGTSINYSTQELKTNYLFDNFLLRKNENTVKLCLVTRLPISGFVYLYEGNYNDITMKWEFSSIPTQFQVLENKYGFDINNEHIVVQYVSIIPSSLLERPKGFDYRQENLMVLMSISSLGVKVDPIFDNVELFNTFQDWYTQNSALFILIIVALVGITSAIIYYLIRRIPKVKKFLLNTEEVGEYPLRVLIKKNLLRYFENTFETFKIIGFTNRKRTFLTIFSLLITGFLLNSILIISESQQPAVINAFYQSQDLSDNRMVTAEFTSTIEHLEDTPSGFTPYYHELAEEEMVEIYSDFEVGKYTESIKSSYFVQIGAGLITNQYLIASFPNDTSDVITMFLTEGRAPIHPYEIVVSTSIRNRFSLNLNDSLNLTISSFFLNVEDPENFTVGVSAVGFYDPPTSSELKLITEYQEQPYDLFRKVRMSGMLTTNDNLFQIFASSQKFDLLIRGYFQFEFNFVDFKMKDRIVLLNEQKTIVDKTFTFTFDSYSSITISNEMLWLFGSFNNYYLQNMARILIFAFPALLLSIFMIIESSDLFSTSYEQEVDILRKKGFRRGKIAKLYLSVRIVEALVATLISFGIAVITAIPLIRIDGFFRFTNQETELILRNIIVKMLIVFAVLVTISIPKIISIASAKRKHEKDPKKGSNLFKKLPWRDLSILILGIVLFQIFYNRTYIAFYTQTVSNYISYLILTMLGALFLIVGGLPIFIKVLSIAWRLLGYVFWKSRKNKFSYIFAEISKDIRYFENITVIFLLVIIIIIPSIVIPSTKEDILTQQAQFQNGSDLMISNWYEAENVSQEQINSLEKVKNSTHLRLYSIIFGALSNVQLLVINTSDFLSTAYQPTQDVIGFNWADLPNLDNNSIIISKTIVEKFKIYPGEELLFTTIIEWIVVSYSVSIISSFELFPVFHNERDSAKNNTLIVLSSDCFDIIEPFIMGLVLITDALLVRLEDIKDVDEMKELLFTMSQNRVISYIDVKETLATPLYNIFIIEILLSLGVACMIFVFSSYTTATKVIEKRVIKHELMKKIGLKANTIVNLTLAECVLAALIPGLGIGTIIGFSVLNRLLSLLSYAAEPYSIYTIIYPGTAIIIFFLLIPFTLYLSLNWNLRREFRRYAPTQME